MPASLNVNAATSVTSELEIFFLTRCAI